MVKAKVYFAGNILDPAKEARRVQIALDAEAKRIKRNLESHVKNWSTPVTFTISNDSAFTRTIATDSDIFLYQDGGTKPHVIRPKVKSALRFNLPSVGVVFAQKVNHPGTKAQNWTKAEANRATASLRKELA